MLIWFLSGLIWYQGWIVYRTWSYQSYWSWLYPKTDYFGFRTRRSEHPRKYFTYLTVHSIFFLFLLFLAYQDLRFSLFLL